MKKLIYLILLMGINQIFAQSIYKPKGCSASTGPNVSPIVLQNLQDRYHLITMKWADIETSPGVFKFSGLQNQINTVKSYNKKYALAIVSGGTGSPNWLIDTLHVPFIDYLFQGTTPYKLPLWWDTVVQQRISIMVKALGNQFANDTSLALVYVTQMSANGIEGHLNGFNMTKMYDKGFTPANWINAAKQTAYYFANAFTDKAIAFEVHEIDNSEEIPKAIINDLYNDSSLCQRVGAAIWWLSGKTSYQSDLLNFLQSFQGDKYAQMIGKSSETTRFEKDTIASAFAQAKQLGIRYIEPWFYEYQNNTINNLLLDFNNWVDLNYKSYDTCNTLSSIPEEDFNSNKISISPNPATEYIEISFDAINPMLKHGVNEGADEIKIYNTFGELVISDVQHLGDVGHLTRIDISHLPIGLYFTQIGNYKEKFMVVR